MLDKLNVYTKLSKEKIKLSAKPFASGGEGALYEIASPRNYGHLVAKLYHANKLTKEREQKMEYLLQHPPSVKQSKKHNEVAWLIDILYRDKKFVGVLMSKIKGKKLTMLCLPKLPRRAHRSWKRFAFGAPDALNLRLKTCFNLAIVIHQIHRTGKYVLADLKPDNILMQANGLLALVDMDSVQVAEHGQAIFLAPVATPEYTPPEFYKSSEDKALKASWDRFSMGVIFYQLLFGLHPFAASAKAPFDKYVGLHEKIEQGLYVHHSLHQSQGNFLVVPPPHLRFEHLPPSLQNLFSLCFEVGHQAPERRPSAYDWGIALAEVLGLKIDLPTLLGPDGLGIKPSPYYKSPLGFVEKKALVWDLEDLEFNVVDKAIKPLEELVQFDKKQVQETELNLIWDGYKQAMQNRFVLQKVDFDEKVKQNKKNKLQHHERNAVNFFKGLGVFVITAFITIYLENPSIVRLFLPFFIFLILYMMSLFIRKEFPRPKIEDIPLRPVNIDVMTKLLYGIDNAAFSAKKNRLKKETQYLPAELIALHQKLIKEKDDLAKLDTSFLLKEIKSFKAQKREYTNSLKRHEKELIKLVAKAKKIRDKEYKELNDKINNQIHLAEFASYKAKDFAELLFKTKTKILKIDKKYRELMVFQDFPELAQKYELMHQKASKKASKDLAKFETELDQEISEIEEQLVQEFMPSNFSQNMGTILASKNKAIANLKQSFDLKPDQAIANYEEYLSLLTKVQDIEITTENTIDSTFDSFQKILTNWDKEVLPNLFKFKRNLSIILRRPESSQVPKKQALSNYNSIQDRAKHIQKISDHLIKEQLSKIFLLLEMFPNKLQDPDFSQAMRKKEEDLIFTLIKEFKENYSNFVQAVQATSKLREGIDAKHLETKIIEANPKLEQELRQLETEAKDKIIDTIANWKKKIEHLESNQTSAYEGRTKKISKHQNKLAKELKIETNKIYEQYANELAKAQEAIVKTRIDLLTELEKAKQPLKLLKEFHKKTILATQESYKARHLAIQEEAKQNYEAMLLKKEKLVASYKQQEELLSDYNLAMAGFDQIEQDYKAMVQAFQVKTIQLAKFETLDSWNQNFDKKIAIEDLPDADKIEIKEAIKEAVMIESQK